MPTPMHVFAEIARRYGVDFADENRVDRFYMEEVPQLPMPEQVAIWDELLARDGEPPKEEK